jgi:glycosyltransferase involved in cell wall biosynthesis
VKTALVSHVLPPTWSGQSMILERLLRGFDPSSYVLVRTMRIPEGGSYTEPLPGKMFDVPSPLPSLPVAGLRGVVSLLRGLLATVRQRAALIAEIVQAERCDSIVVCTGGDMLDIPAAYLAARRTGVRFIPYYFDHWSQQAVSSPRLQRLIKRLEPYILRRASSVIVPNEFLARDLQMYGRVRTAIVRNACDVPSRRLARTGDGRAPLSIVYTGAVYAANHDAFRNLVDVLRSGGLDATLNIYTAQSADEIAEAGIRGPVSVNPHRPLNEIPSLQADADILFLPLAFESPFPALIRSSSPAKMGEYLAAGRPILVHAPHDSFVAHYFGTHGCGLVVGELERAPLAEAVRSLVDDDGLRDRIGEAAHACALADFDIETARASFAATVGIDFASPEAAAKPIPRLGPDAGSRRL